MKQYLDQLRYILENGEKREDRTGVGTIGVFGLQSRYDLRKNFPLLTTKRVWMKGVIHELLWILSGSSNIKYLQDNNVHIWDEWADENGELGPVYGVQWRKWRDYGVGKVERYDGMTVTPIGPREIDQITNLVDALKNNPYSRRHILNAWNVGKIDKMGLPPCHMMCQFYVSKNKELSCQMYQRSADFFLGVPFNIASYSLLTHMLAQVCDLQVGEFVHTLGDAHIYLNHQDQVKEQLSREPYEPTAVLELNSAIKNIDDFTYDDIVVKGYKSHPTIKAPIAV